MLHVGGTCWTSCGVVAQDTEMRIISSLISPPPPPPPLLSLSLSIPLFIVDTGKVSVDNGMVGTEAEGSQVGRYCSIEYPGLLQDIA